VVVEFRDKDSGKLIRILMNATGKPLVDSKGMVTLEIDGTDRLCRKIFLALDFWSDAMDVS